MRYVVGVLGVVLIALVAVLLIVSRSPSTTTSKTPTSGIVKLADFSDKNSVITLTTRGRLVGDTERRAIRVSIMPTERRIEVLSGYDENTISSQSYPNTQSGYSNFLYAMDRAGFARTRKATITEAKGVCPLGNQYAYTVTNNGSTPVNTWSTSCSLNEGTFGGSASVIRQLFQLQIPDYSQQINSVRL